jgi:hypothetical protein
VRTINKLKLPPDYGYNFGGWMPIPFIFGARDARGDVYP